MKSKTDPPNFDRLAGVYRWMELFSFGPWLWGCRTAFLGELANCRRALSLGDGDGRFTARLLESNPTIFINAVDASPVMLQALRRRASINAARVQTHLADARQWQPEASSSALYDLAVTHFFLDCLTTDEVHALAAKLAGALSPSALWVVSEFAVPQGIFGRLIAAPVVAGLYWAFGWLTGLQVRSLPDYRSALGDSGFALRRNRRFLGGLLVSEFWVKQP
jgi:SAM-dependent methyltransferase